MSEAQKDPASEVYENVNFLMLKHTCDYLCDLETWLLEDFVRKYSGIIIFLLNVLDADRSRALLKKLSTESLLSLVEEELRMLAIREIAWVGDDFERMTFLSGFMDGLDRHLTGADLKPEEITEIGNILQSVHDGQRENTQKVFAYLEYFGESALNKLYDGIYHKNIYVSFGLILFASEKVRIFLLKHFAQSAPSMLAAVPYNLFSLNEYELFVSEKVRIHLPEKVKERLSFLVDIGSRKKALIKRIEDRTGLSRNELIRADKTGKTQMLDLIYEELKELNPETQSAFLTELVSERVIGENDADILETFFSGGMSI